MKSDIEAILNGSEEPPGDIFELLSKLVEYAKTEQHVLILKPSEIKQVKTYIAKLEAVAEAAREVVKNHKGELIVWQLEQALQELDGDTPCK